MDASAIFVDVEKTFGKQAMVMGPAREFYPRTPRDAKGDTTEDRTKPIEGYKVKLGSNKFGVAGFNVKLPADFDPKSVKKGDLVELVEATGRPYGNASDSGFVDIEISVTAKALRKVPAAA